MSLDKNKYKEDPIMNIIAQTASQTNQSAHVIPESIEEKEVQKEDDTISPLFSTSLKNHPKTGEPIE